MKKSFLFLTLTLAFTLAACGTSTAPTAIPTVALDAAAQPAAESSATSGKASASAEVVPLTTVELAFPLSGSVKTVEVEEGDTVKTGDVLVTLDTAILEARVRDAEAVVAIEETQLAYLKRTKIDNERLIAAQAEIDRALAAVDIAKVQLAQATLAAPMDGTVISVEISPAEFASPGQIIIVIADLSRFQVETTDLSEKDVPGITIGQNADVYIEALDQDFTGKVVDIARTSQTVGGDVVFTVTIELDTQPEGLRWGMSAEVKVLE